MVRFILLYKTLGKILLDPENGTNGHMTLTNRRKWILWFFGANQYFGTDNDVNANFGGYTILLAPDSAETDENGYGSFEFAPPSGYYALCTKNLAEYG